MTGSNSATGNFESADASRTNRWTFGRDNAVTGNFVLAYNGSPFINTTSAGNVGIGTPSPVSGGLTVYGASNGQVFVQNSSGHTRLLQNSTDFYIDGNVSGSAGSIVFRRSSSTLESMRITAAGNVHAASGTTTMTDGFFYIPAAAGAPTGVPTAIAGRVPMYYDTTNDQFYIRNGANWRKVTLT